MKITSVESLVLDGQYLFLKVHTDEGLVGIGECFRRQFRGTQAVIEEVLAPVIVGADPFDIEAIWNRMHHTITTIGTHGFSATAMAGIDVALWDLKGKALGVPVYQLLGGKVRDRVRVYASSLRRDMAPVEEARRAAALAEQGFSAYKLHSAVPGAIDDPADRTIATVREVRQAVGDEVDILVDVNGAYSPHHAIEIGKRLEDYGVFHFEEPVPFYDLPGLAQIAEALAIPIAAGEMQFNRWQFRDLIVQGRVDILQPDVVKAGGLSECQKIAALASSFNKPISTHNTQPTVCTAATLHFCAVHEHTSYAQEYNIEPVPIRDEWPILATPIEVVDGHIAVPEAPGLGIELDDAVVKRLQA